MKKRILYAEFGCEVMVRGNGHVLDKTISDHPTIRGRITVCNS